MKEAQRREGFRLWDKQRKEKRMNMVAQSEVLETPPSNTASNPTASVASSAGTVRGTNETIRVLASDSWSSSDARSPAQRLDRLKLLNTADLHWEDLR
jgi:hypothetical protein